MNDTEPGKPTTRRVTGAEGVELAVTEWGDPAAPTVVLVHGYPDTSAVWAGAAARLASRHHVVAYDVRGAGDSASPGSGRDGYALRLLVEDLAAVVDATSPTRPVHLVGHDWGSIQGWEAVTSDRLTGRIASFTSISGPYLGHVHHWVRERLRRPRPRGLRQLAAQGRRSWYVTAFQLPGAPRFWRRGGSRLVAASLVRMGEWPEGSEPAPTLAADGARGVQLYRANRRPGPARLTDVPVQLVVPRDDRWVTPALSEGVERWAPRLWRRDVPGRHWLPRTHPERVARWVEELVAHAEGAPEPPGLRRHRVGPAARHSPAAARPAAREAARPTAAGEAARPTAAGEAARPTAAGPAAGTGGARSAAAGLAAVGGAAAGLAAAGVAAGTAAAPAGTAGHAAGAGAGADAGARGAASAGAGLRSSEQGGAGGDGGRPDEGRVVVVTGAGSGIGRATAIAFARRGAHVVAADIVPDAAARTAALCRDAGGTAADVQVDVGDEAAMADLARRIETDHGAADVVVNNAGVAVVGPVLDTSSADWDHVLRVNLWGVIHGSRLLGRQMVARGEGGHIVNVASAAAFVPSRAFPAYATSKAAVLMLTECLRAELAGEGIGVSAICPGVVDTGIVGTSRWVGVDDDEAARRRTRAVQLYTRRGYTPDRVAAAVVRAVERDRAVVPVTPEAVVGRMLARLSPGLARRLARIDPAGRL